MDIIVAAVSVLLFALLAYEKYRAKLQQKLVFDLTLQVKVLEAEKKAFQEVEKTFKLLSQEALEKNTDHFIKTAADKQAHLVSVITPVKETLEKLTSSLHSLEKERKGDHEGLKVQLRALKDSELLLKEETRALASALKNPVARGMWGEVQLKRVLELSGLLPYCDFYEQQVLKADKLRPDVIVKLSGGRQLVIDAKAPLEAYLEACSLEAESDKQKKLQDHASKIRDHITALSKKSYFESLNNSIEFVILFLPQESLFSAALSVDPTLIELGARHQVIIATPTTLLALLKAVAFGWKQETLSQQVEAIKLLGKELYKRVGDLNAHFSKLGKNLNSAVDAYNKTLGCLESRVLVSLRKFDNLGIDTHEAKVQDPELITEAARDPVYDS